MTAQSTAPRSAPARTGRLSDRLDFGRVGVVVLFSLTAASNVGSLARHLVSQDALWQKAAEVTSSVLALSFCALVVRAYLRRGRAAATDRGWLVWLAAPLATVVPLGIAAVPPRTHGLPVTAVQLALTLGGLALAVWSVRTLSTNLSIVPQARVAITYGPYRLVRHPLYLGELVALVGLAWHVGRWPAALVFGVEVLLQVYRAGREERLLIAVVPGYREYAARTHRLIPGLW